MNQPTGAPWQNAAPAEQATYFAPPGSIALPAQDLRPTDDGGPLPLMLPSPLPALPLPNAAEGEVYSTVHASDDALRDFAAVTRATALCSSVTRARDLRAFACTSDG